MASDLSFVQYVQDQLAPLGGISYRKMFGEFALYRHGKVVALVCDNQLYVKPTEPGQRLVGTPVWGAPYPGAKPHLQATDLLDEREHLCRLIHLTWEALPEPKAKAPKTPKVPKAPAALKATPRAQPTPADAPVAELARLANLGPQSARTLYAAGVPDRATLERLGAVAAYALAKAHNPRVSLNLLWALEGALTHTDWKVVAAEHRTRLLLALDAHLQQPGRA